MLSIMSRNSVSGPPRSRPRPPTCSICSMMGHNRRGCHLNPNHMDGESINLIRYRSNNRTHRNILAQQRHQQRQHTPQQPQPLSYTEMSNELSNIAITLYNRGRVSMSSSSSSSSSSYSNNLLSKPEDLMAPVNEVFASENCPICMETLGKTNVITSRCGHQMCVGCFTRNLVEAKSNKCPVCRVPVV